MKPLVSTEWLADNLGEVRVFDCTYYLPTDGRDAMAEFTAGHIPSAGFFNIETIADTDSDQSHMVPTPGRFARLMGEMGITNTSRIVFYDQKGLNSAARGWWMMGLFGNDRSAVLDGGLPKWVAEGRSLEAGLPPRAKPAIFRPDFRAARLRGIGDMMDVMSSRSEIMLDARSAARFHATVAEPRPGIRSGHIPGAVSLPISEVMTAEQTMLPADQLRAKLAALGVDGSRPVVTSCGSGVTATILTLAMARAGLPLGAVYDGSWSEWGSRTDTPVEI